MNSAQRSHEEIRGTNWFRFFFLEHAMAEILGTNCHQKHGNQNALEKWKPK
jgi:hypothetical protein